jgi:hypothetical protein
MELQLEKKDNFFFPVYWKKEGTRIKDNNKMSIEFKVVEKGFFQLGQKNIFILVDTISYIILIMQHF